MRFGIALAVFFSSATALAQTTNVSGGDAWSDFSAQDQALANTSTQDCATACKALESLARAAQHICDVSPEHCEEAKSRLRAATDRVHAACPQCSVSARVDTAQTPPQPTVYAGQNVSVESAHGGGGCAGCTSASSSPDFGAALFAVVALALARRKKSRSDV